MRNLHVTALRAAVTLLLIAQWGIALHAQTQEVWLGNININGSTHDVVNSDIYIVGNPAQDPILALTASNSSVVAGDALNLSLSLGDASRTVDRFFGITFTIKFDPQYFADELAAPLWNPDVFNLDLLPNTWLNGNNGNGAEAFVQLNNEAGEIEVLILRKEPGESSGHGNIASIMIIVEDIAFLEDIETGITVEKIKMVDQNLVEYPVAGSTEYVTILATPTQAMTTTDKPESPVNSVVNKESTNSVKAPTLEGNPPFSNEEQLQINVYPNPVVNQVTIATKEEGNVLKNVRLFSAAGQLLADHQPATEETQIDMTNLPKGNYFLQMTTNKGTTVKQVTK